jgi:hypothetical protein
VNVGDDTAVYAFIREKGREKVFVILNFSANPQQIAINDKTLFGDVNNVFKGSKEQLNSKAWNISPWGYVVYEYNSK